MGFGLRVVEVGSSVAGAYCGRLLGMLGADVVKIEPVGGDPMRAAHPLVPAAGGGTVSALFEYLNCFKRSVGAGVDAPPARLRALQASADIVVSSVDGDPDAAGEAYTRLAAANPELIYVAISSFGLTGPYRQ